jgi:hypothetical protein
MRNACTLAHHNHVNLAHTHHQSRMYHYEYLVVYYAYDAHRSRRDHMHKTRCLMNNRSRSRRT